METGHHKVEGFDVQAVDVAHKGGRTFGLRVSDGAGSLAYLPDHAPAAGMSDDLLEMLDGVDVLVHDAQFLDGERPVAVDYGHATVEDCLGLARRCGAGTLVLFHHSPARTDDALDAIKARAESLADGLPVVLAVQGMAIDVGPHGQVSAVPEPRSSASR